MTLSPRRDNSHDKLPNKRALGFGVGATSVAIGTIIAAGGNSGVDNGTIRLAVIVFGILMTLSLVGGLIAARRDGSSHENSEGGLTGEAVPTPRRSPLEDEPPARRDDNHRPAVSEGTDDGGS